ncbi:hypothetical protein GEMRC1_004605 [Eukaryota sp. GEM-RC1]
MNTVLAKRLVNVQQITLRTQAKLKEDLLQRYKLLKKQDSKSTIETQKIDAINQRNAYWDNRKAQSVRQAEIDSKRQSSIDHLTTLRVQRDQELIHNLRNECQQQRSLRNSFKVYRNLKRFQTKS